MKILILGANGYLGARLFFDLDKDFKVVGTYNKKQLSQSFINLDITDKKHVKKVFEEIRPNIILHAANEPTARGAEVDEKGFKRLNLDASKFIKDAANSIGAKIIFISSVAALNPSDIYGELKLKSEEIIKNTKAGYLILRPSLILGFSPNTENDRPFNRILKCLDNKTITEFDTSWEFQPTYIGHISQVIIQAINNNIFNKTVHLVSPKKSTRFSTAKDILEPFEIEVQPIDKKMSTEFIEITENELDDLNLPPCSYELMIKQIHYEIKNRDKFKL